MGKIEMEIKFERGQMKIQPACMCYPACILYLWDTPPHFCCILCGGFVSGTRFVRLPWQRYLDSLC